MEIFFPSADIILCKELFVLIRIQTDWHYDDVPESYYELLEILNCAQLKCMQNAQAWKRNDSLKETAPIDVIEKKCYKKRNAI